MLAEASAGKTQELEVMGQWEEESLGGVFTPMASAGHHLGTHLGLWATHLCPLHVAWHRGVAFIM